MSILSLITPTPTPKLIEKDSIQLVDEEYNQLASSLGVACKTRPEKLKLILSEEMIPVYDLARVERYMDRRGPWAWFPLRVIDRDGLYAVINKDIRQSATRHSWLGATRSVVYDQPVPYPVLCTVNKLVERLGREVEFFVAAADRDPDPFLGCRLKGDPSHIYVIERWDEPSFR